MKFILELEIDPFDEMGAIDCAMSVTNYNKPIMYWEGSNLCELSVKSAKLVTKEGD